MSVYVDYVGQGSIPAGGHFRMGLKTGLTTILNSGDPVISLRWTDQSHQFVLHHCRAWANINTAFTTAQMVDLELFVARGFTASDTGGTAALPAGNMNQMRDVGGARMNTSGLGDLRAATTVALGVGTRTLDGNSVGVAMFNQANALASTWEAVMYDCRVNEDHPLILGANEGLVWTIATTQGAVGKVRYYVNLVWSEVLTYY